MRIFKYIIYITIPAFSSYLASDRTIVQWLIRKRVLAPGFNIQLFQSLCLLCSIIFSTFVLNLKLISYERNGERLRKERDGLYNVIKEFVNNNFVNISGDENFTFNLRIFVPEVRISRLLKSLLFHQAKEKWFVICNIEPFAKKDITEHLRFRVEPQKQGLVGDAYGSKSIVYDDTLELTNSTNYSLEQTQLHRTSNLKWSLCVPILDDNNTVVAIMAFDSDSSQLDINLNKDEIRTLANVLAIMMRDSVPDLFKPKWSIR